MSDEVKAIPLGPNVPLNPISEQDSRHLGANCWDPETWVAQGFVRNWGDAAVMDDYFEVLMRKHHQSGGVEFVVLCPTFLRRPLKLYFPSAWASY